MKNRGIIYIAIGKEYRRMAVQSAESIVTNYLGECHQIIILTTDSFNFRLSPYISIKQIRLKCPADPAVATAYLKTDLNYLSEFDETLYLDCDTKAIGDLSGLWTYIRDSIAVAPAYNPIRQSVVYPHNSEATETSICLSKIDDYTQYNTGVLLFKNTLHSDKIFKLWRKEWQRFKHHENMAFTRTIAQGFNVDPLPPKYNQFYDDVDADTVLIHYVGGYKKHL
jgi:Glycosyl transferase family 8